jgi:hypothetical protein
MADQIEESTAPYHEAGHAVMRWLEGLRATETVADHLGGGFCAGTGKMINAQSALYVTLAGFAAEAAYEILGAVDLSSSKCVDFDDARQILDQNGWLRIVATEDHQIVVQGVDEALRRYFTHTCEVLYPHASLVDRIADRLELEGRLSARAIAAVFREYGKSNAVNEGF